jgi:hypothetical protein
MINYKWLSRKNSVFAILFPTILGFFLPVRGKRYLLQMGHIFLFFSLIIYEIGAESLFSPPLPEDAYTIHFGELFCDEMYYYSYRSKKFHTANDYIKKWNSEHIVKGETDYNILLNLYKKQFLNVPEKATFWKSKDSAISFMKLNLYRDGFDIVDTTIGLYPKEILEKSYGYGELAFSVYPGITIDTFDPTEPSGWGKSLLIEHLAPENMVFEINWLNRTLRLDRFYSGYFHNSANLVKKGDYIKRGDPVSRIGDANGIFNSTHGKLGIREGAHLHFEIRLKKYSLFPDTEVLSNKEKLTEIYIDPDYFLKNAKLVKK